MNCYQLVKTVLDELYDQLPFSCESDKDKAIFDELKVLREKYPELTNGMTINYGDCTTRFAYIYRYVAAHAFTTYALIRDTPELASLFNKSPLRVCCLGGGPGSELLGILKYMEKNNKSSTLNCRVYDREERWRESLGSVCNQLISFSLLPSFRTLDVVDAEAWTKYPELIDSNLFTMSFFISELYSRRQRTEGFLIDLFKKSKRSSMFLFIDNSSHYSREWFDRLVKMHNQQGVYGKLQLIKKSEGHGFQLENGEQAKDLEPYISKFVSSKRGKSDESNEVGLPRSYPQVDYRIYHKE